MGWIYNVEYRNSEREIRSRNYIVFGFILNTVHKNIFFGVNLSLKKQYNGNK